VARWAGRRAEPAPVRVLADGNRDAWQPAVRFDPLIDPVAITGHCVIGDQIRVPAAWCAMAGCQAAFADPAALGEADNRARAVAAGWAKDAVGRLICPACQRERPVPAWWVPAREPGTAGGRGPDDGTARPAGGTIQSVRPAVWGPPAAVQGRYHRTQWPRLLSALVSGRDGWTARAGRGSLTRAQCRAGPGPLLLAMGELCMPPDLLDAAPGAADGSDDGRLNRSGRGRGSPPANRGRTAPRRRCAHNQLICAQPPAWPTRPFAAHSRQAGVATVILVTHCSLRCATLTRDIRRSARTSSGFR
jgi:hypothetical protein